MKFWKRLAYAEGNFANTVCGQVFTNRVQFFYVDVIGVGAGLIGLLWSIFGIWNAINDPLMGALTDRTRTRWGRRIPYLVAGAIPLGIAFALIFNPPTHNLTITALYLFVMVIIYDTLYSLIVMVYNAMFPEVAVELKDRSNLSAIRTGMGIVALLVAYILAPTLVESIGYRAMGVVIGVLTAAGYLITVLGSKENLEHMKAPRENLIVALQEAIANKHFRWYLPAEMSRDFIFLITSASLPFWSKYVLRLAPLQLGGAMLSSGEQEAILLAVPFLLSVPCLVVWNYLTPRIGAQKTWIAGVLSFLPACFIILFVADGFATGLLGTALMAPGIAAESMMPLINLSEVVDEHARRTGKRKEGAFMGTSSGLSKLSFTVQGLLFAIVLPLTGYVPNAVAQTPAAVGGIRFLMGGATVFAVLIAAYCLSKLRIPAAEAGFPSGTRPVALATPMDS